MLGEVPRWGALCIMFATAAADRASTHKSKKDFIKDIEERTKTGFSAFAEEYPMCTPGRTVPKLYEINLIYREGGTYRSLAFVLQLPALTQK